MLGNLHAQFLEGWAPAMGSGYSVNFQVRFLEGWPPAMGAGHSAFQGKDFHGEEIRPHQNFHV